MLGADAAFEAGERGAQGAACFFAAPAAQLPSTPRLGTQPTAP
jgi:hypothetical protein